jgi:hypothetical protein
MFRHFRVVAVGAAILGMANIGSQVAASPWPVAEKAPVKAPPADYPNKPTGWTVRQNDASQPMDLEWRDSTGMFAIVSREYWIPFDSQFLASSAFEKLPMEIGNRLLEPTLLYRAYLVKDGKYFELPTPLGYTLVEAAGHVEMWSKGDKLDMLDGIPAKGGRYHKPYSSDLTEVRPEKARKPPALKLKISKPKAK